MQAGSRSMQEAATALSRYMRPADPRPSPCLRDGGRALTAAESQAAWCRQLTRQCEWPGPFDEAFHHHVHRVLPHLFAFAWGHRGSTAFDAQITQAEVRHILQSWGHTAATTPDLIPRVVLQLSHGSVDDAVLRVMQLVGPGGLALRPRVWRGSSAVALHKVVGQRTQ